MSMQSNYPRPNLGGKDSELCPQCNQPTGKRVRYTWWGGALGPAMFSLTKCHACGYQYNAKTGKPTTKAIIVYNIVSFVIAFVILMVLYFPNR